MLRNFLTLVALSLASPSFAADWVQVETRHFIVHSNDKPSDIEKFVGNLERYDKLMRMATGIEEDDPVKVRIYQVATESEIERALGFHDTTIAGFYSDNSFGPFAVTPKRVLQSSAHFTPELVLHHEYAHHFMLQYFPANYPSWYVEGFAELIGSSLILKDGRIGYGMPAKQRGHDLLTDWVPLQELLTKERVQNVDIYGQGWALTHFFTLNSDRAKLFRAYLDALQQGKSMAESAKVFGDLDQLNRAARSYVSAGSFLYKPVDAQVGMPVILKSRPMTPGEVEAIPALIAFDDSDLASYRKDSERVRREKLRRSNLARIQGVAAQYPNDTMVQKTLAEIELSLGGVKGAEVAIDRALAVSPTDVHALARKSILISMQLAGLSSKARSTAAAKARTMAVRANKTDPSHPLPLVAYYQSFNLAGEKVPDVAITGLRQVVSLVPGNPSYRWLLVEELAKQGQFREAVMWLTPLANSLHASPSREKARELLKKLQDLASKA